MKHHGSVIPRSEAETYSAHDVHAASGDCRRISQRGLAEDRSRFLLAANKRRFPPLLMDVAFPPAFISPD